MSAVTVVDNARQRWRREGRRLVLATLVETVGSAPFGVGAEMLIDEDGRLAGSVTGGCVEGALVEEAHRVLARGTPSLITYGGSEDGAADVSLRCEGTVRIFVHEISVEADEAMDCAAMQSRA